jgi:hypothetical protein
MNLKIRLIAFNSKTILKAALSICLLIILLIAVVTAQTKIRTDSGELYAGIELGADGARAVALRISSNGEEPGVKLIYSEDIHLSLGRTSAGDFSPQAASEAGSAVKKLLMRLRQEHRVPDEHIYLIGSSQLGADQPEGLIKTINKATGKTLTFLDAATEVQLSIVGTIPQRERNGDTWIDNRTSSVLFEIGGGSTLGGYQLLKYSPPAPPRYEFVTMNIPYGAVSFANEVSRAVGERNELPAFIQHSKELGAASFRKSLQKAREGKPGLLTRKRVYLSGGIVRALATLLHPEERQSFVPLTAQDIATFVNKAYRDPVGLLDPNLSQIRSRELRQEIERELETVRNNFTPQQIVAGAEMLRAAADEFDWEEKTLWFARFGHLSRILSYVRLQAEK